MGAGVQDSGNVTDGLYILVVTAVYSTAARLFSAAFVPVGLTLFRMFNPVALGGVSRRSQAAWRCHFWGQNKYDGSKTQTANRFCYSK